MYLNEVYDYCSYCLTRTQVLIPCHHCSKALFCSKYCMAKAVEKYHRIECPLMEYLVSLEPEDQHVHYILRLLCFLSHQVYFLFVSKRLQTFNKNFFATFSLLILNLILG